MTIMEIGVFSGFTPDKDSLIEVNGLLFCLFAKYDCYSLLTFSNDTA